MLEEVKILFREYSDVLDEYVVETLWATTIDSDNGKYRIENVPFYVKTAFLNIVHAEFDQDEGFLVFKKNIIESGNSTIQVVMLNSKIGIETIRTILESKGCESEKFSDNFFVLDVPAKANYTAILKKLNQLHEQQIIDYGELYLSEIHS